MFDIVRNNRSFVQIFLVLITLPFAFWGVESYVRSGGTGDAIARVGDSKIMPQEFQRALQEQQEKLRLSLGPNATPEMLDSPQIRHAVLDSMISQRLLLLHAAKVRIGISDSALLQFISSIPSLQENGKFSRERYEAIVASQGMSKEAFETRLRQDLVMQQASGAVAGASLAGRQAGASWLAAMLEERELAEAHLSPDQYASRVKLAPNAVRTYYDGNPSVFSVPEQVRAEYLVLSQSDMEAQQNIGEEEMKSWYEAHLDRYRQPEQRRASHILIAVPAAAAGAKLETAKKRAEDVLAQARKSPAGFAALAKQYSQDTGSAQNGGDLGWFGRGAMVKPFEEAAFALKEGEISDLVRSDFGFHIILLAGIHAEQTKPLQEVRPEIVHELRAQAAAKKYAELAESFSNTVYEQADSLQPAADKFKLKIEQTGWIEKGGAGQGLFANTKLLGALFSEDAIKDKRNTEAIEVEPKTLVSARVLEYRPATMKPFEEVRSEIEKKLTLEEAGKLSQKDGMEKLARLQKGETEAISWGAVRGIARVSAQNLSPAAVKSVFAIDTARLPAYTGISAPDGGYVLYRISQVKPYSGTDNPRAEMLRQQYARIVAGVEFDAWLAVLRQRYPVKIDNKALKAEER